MSRHRLLIESFGLRAWLHEQCCDYLTLVKNRRFLRQHLQMSNTTLPEKATPVIKTIRAGLAQITYRHRTFETFMVADLDGVFVREIHEFAPFKVEWKTGSYETRKFAVECIVRLVDQEAAQVDRYTEMLNKGRAARAEIAERDARNALGESQ